MRGNLKIRSAVATALFAAVAMTASFAQTVPPRPVGEPPARPTFAPRPTMAPPLSLPTPRPVGGAASTPTASPAAGGGFGGGLLANSRLGPKIPLSSFPALPPQTSLNTVGAANGGRHTMAATDASIMYETYSGCSSTVGYIFNVGCQIEFQLAYCNTSNTNANCSGISGTTSITRTDTFQDYYIDANSGTAQTIGSTYVPNTATPAPGSAYTCSSTSTCDYGPSHTLTLNNAGTVVLASYDVTQSTWVAVVYITVGSASALETFSDAGRLTPQTQFSIPSSSSTNTVYITIGNAQYSDVYVVYIENTSVTASCTGELGPTSAGPSAGLCNPAAITGTKALSSGNLYMQWTFGNGTNWTSLSSGTYSLVAYDQTAGKRVAQTQISLLASSGVVTASLSGVGGNPSPNPAATSTPSSRFAFDNTSDQSDYEIVTSLSGLTSAHHYCISITDPNGRVYQDYTTPSEKFTCFTATGSTDTLTHVNSTSEQPDYFAPNTYTIQVCDFSSGSPCTLVGTQALQMLGYHLTTDFTDAAGTTNQGNSLVVPKNGTTTGGLYFVNDGDTYYGGGNGDTISAIEYSTGGSGGSSGNGSYFTLSSSSLTGLTGTCTVSCYGTITDSSGNTWNVYELQNGGGANQYTTLEICPTSWGNTCSSPASSSTKLAMNATITIPQITFFPPPGSSSCTGGNCQAPTTILPTDGQTWSVYASTQASQITYFTNSNGNTYTGTGSFVHLGVINSGCSSSGCGSAFNGTVTSPCTPTSSGYGGREQHGYFTNMTQALYAANEPFTATAGQADVYCVKVTNNSSAGTITGLAFTLPSTYSGASTTTWSVDVASQTGGSLCGGTNTCWAHDTTSGKCPSGANFCIKPIGLNSGVVVGGTQTIYIDVQGLPSSSFSFAEVAEQVYNPVTYSLTADTSCCTSSFLNTIPVSSTAPTQTTVDALALGAYSIDSTYMTPLFNPTSEGISTSNTVQVSLKNTSTAQDTNPDYVDAVVFEFPSSSYLGTSGFSPSNLTTGWTYLGYNSPGAGGGSTIDYWFGVCSAQYSASSTYWPLSNPTSSTTNSLPRYGGAGGSGCTATQEQSALAPGSSLSFNTVFNAPSSAGSVTSTVWAHGANGNGWSKSATFALTIASTSATAGFSKAGTYGAPGAVSSSPASPAFISTDSNTTYGNSYVYTITNTSGTGHNLTSATITVPGKDSSGALPADGTAWTITSAPTVTGGSGCSVQSYSSATTGGSSGSIVIGGGSCSLSPNSTWTVSFTAKGPYTVNDQYQFAALVNGNVNASEQWVGDTYVEITLGASLRLTVGPSQNANGYAYSYSCPTCIFTQATNTIDFGTIIAGGASTGTDVALLDLSTNASTPQSWAIYVTQQNSNNPTAATYLQTEVDNSSTSGCPTGNSCISFQPKSGTSYGTTSWTAIPVTSTATSGLVIGSTSSGTAATRSAFEFSNGYRIVIPAAGNTAASTSTVTYTFIAN